MVVYRVYPDGKEELVRGVDLIGTPLIAFSKIAATDDQVAVFNGVCGAESGWVPVSASSPGLSSRRLKCSARKNRRSAPRSCCRLRPCRRNKKNFMTRDFQITAFLRGEIDHALQYTKPSSMAGSPSHIHSAFRMAVATASLLPSGVLMQAPRMTSPCAP